MVDIKALELRNKYLASEVARLQENAVDSYKENVSLRNKLFDAEHKIKSLEDDLFLSEDCRKGLHQQLNDALSRLNSTVIFDGFKPLSVVRCGNDVSLVGVFQDNTVSINLNIEGSDAETMLENICEAVAEKLEVV